MRQSAVNAHGHAFLHDAFGLRHSTAEVHKASGLVEQAFGSPHFSQLLSCRPLHEHDVLPFLHLLHILRHQVARVVVLGVVPVVAVIAVVTVAVVAMMPAITAVVRSRRACGGARSSGILSCCRRWRLSSSSSGRSSGGCSCGRAVVAVAVVAVVAVVAIAAIAVMPAVTAVVWSWRACGGSLSGVLPCCRRVLPCCRRG